MTIETTARTLAMEMEFAFLLDPDRRLLSIGYLCAEDRLDTHCYDLLASEARLASFVAIAKGEIPARHWFRLGREVTPVGHGAALVSWSGSMFEYLMPSLVMRAPRGSLIEKTNELIVQRQIDYARGLGLPWGISELAYNARDKEFTYQYSNFGVPGLGFKRGLSENAVMAPYATALAAMVDPAAATANFATLAERGGRGRYGFYEALDFTPSRLPEGQSQAVVRAYMAHHQGMTVVAIANALLDGIMRTRFHAEPIVQATELLLQERTPRDVAVAHPRAEEVSAGATGSDLEPTLVRRLRNANGASPSVHLLSNGRYAVMLTAAGSGYSRWNDRAVTRWREDTTRDDWGSYVFLRDVESREAWSATWQPSGEHPDSYDVMFAEDRAEFIRRDGSLTTTLDVVVSPEDEAEVRRVSIANAGARGPRHRGHLLCRDRARTAGGRRRSSGLFQALRRDRVSLRRRAPSWRHADGAARTRPSFGPPISRSSKARRSASVEFETDRARFLGRGNDVGNAVAANDGRRLSNTVGRVLDPVFALRRRLRVPAGGTVRIAYWTMVASSREALLDAVDKHQDAQCVRTRRHPGLDAGAGAAAPSRCRSDPGEPLPASGGARPLRQSIDAFVVGRDPPRPGAAAGAVGARHLGRPADRARAHRRPPGCRHRARNASRPRILATEGPGGRPRHPQRARRLVRAGSADRHRDPGAHPPSPAHPASERQLGQRVRPAQRSDRRQHAHLAVCLWRASCCSAAAAAWPISSTGCRRHAARCRRHGAAADAPGRSQSRCAARPLRRICSSSTGWAASRPTAAST